MISITTALQIKKAVNCVLEGCLSNKIDIYVGCILVRKGLPTRELYKYTTVSAVWAHKKNKVDKDRLDELEKLVDSILESNNNWRQFLKPAKDER